MRHSGSIRVSVLDWLSMALVIVGAINWGLVGLGGFVGANWNVVNLLLGGFPAVESLVYVLVGLAGLVEVDVLPVGEQLAVELCGRFVSLLIGLGAVILDSVEGLLGFTETIHALDDRHLGVLVAVWTGVVPARHVPRVLWDVLVRALGTSGVRAIVISLEDMR
jgi:uncharacterized membrane protein YuzA (DUF378 family)